MTEMCGHVVDSLDGLLTTRSKFIDDPLFHEDLLQLLRVCQRWTFRCLTTEQMASAGSLSNDLQRLWSTVDLLFNSSLTFTSADDFAGYGSDRSYLLKLLLYFDAAIYYRARQ